MRGALDSLDGLKTLDATRLAAEPLTRAAMERLVQVVVDLAVEVNAHVAVAAQAPAPTSARASFRAAATAGAIGDDLATELEGAAGLRNLLVHQYVDIDVGLLADALPSMVDGFGRYVTTVAGFVAASTEQG
jgi:uncharacterized protein YutE (UPF0331/DUF86 family)